MYVVLYVTSRLFNSYIYSHIIFSRNIVVKNNVTYIGMYMIICINVL